MPVSGFGRCNDHLVCAVARVICSTWNESAREWVRMEWSELLDGIAGFLALRPDAEVVISAGSVIITGMERQRIIRWLRVAVSAVCVVVCVGLIGLWIRSFYFENQFVSSKVKATLCYVVSREGLVNIIYIPDVYVHISESNKFPRSFQASPSGFQCLRLRGSGWTLAVPHWFLALGFAAFAYVSCPPLGQIRWRFSLRTLLIVTTLVAVVLGLVVWMTG